MPTPPDFSSGAILTAATMSAVGLWKVGTVTATPSAEILVNNVFSSDYTNYRIVISNALITTSPQSIRLQFRDSGGNIGTGHQFGGWFIQMTVLAGTGAYGNTGAASIQIGFSDNTNRVDISADIYRPNISGQTGLTVNGSDSGSANFVAGRQTETKTVTGFRLFGSSGNNISGTVQIFGYRN
jgi:hypothetical protein